MLVNAQSGILREYSPWNFLEYACWRLVIHLIFALSHLGPRGQRRRFSELGRITQMTTGSWDRPEHKMTPDHFKEDASTV
ncbi:hypothetical protein OUZ56_024967 [Daphnia magna]|uniref:Uncharacterized protein n=1 Tax=Daphnia magna TaxID=35525 RepID=A0ABQ9ZIJ6_9CRUS|nr:hypothetical protein OUZ56_024967 [Daphnia magna]